MGENSRYSAREIDIPSAHGGVIIALRDIAVIYSQPTHIPLLLGNIYHFL